MAIRNFFKSAANTLKLARKSDRDEYMLYLKLITLAVGVVGTIGFVIQLISSFIKLG